MVTTESVEAQGVVLSYLIQSVPGYYSSPGDQLLARACQPCHSCLALATVQKMYIDLTGSCRFITTIVVI